MDANPIHVSIAGRMMFKRVMGKSFFLQISGSTGKYPGICCQEMQSEQTLMLILNVLILVIFSDWKDLRSEQEQEKFPSMQRR